MGELSMAPVHRMLKRAGAVRVSEEAAIELRSILESIGMRISERAIEIATSSGRRTVKGEDVIEAARSLFPDLRLKKV
ncbi:MAG: NFYB/HAP3 family transcription factor subunit [Thaumarchaeota archaeon]|nr:NFYB/HAP3 family transcription factor subunit [Candidatus Calditenuaceae archaeon]MDW8187357.1 NFYB/HAP3 family transcription factor subunit [Nitrososphaerota archaeon]